METLGMSGGLTEVELENGLDWGGPDASKNDKERYSSWGPNTILGHRKGDMLGGHCLDLT